MKMHTYISLTSVALMSLISIALAAESHHNLTTPSSDNDFSHASHLDTDANKSQEVTYEKIYRKWIAEQQEKTGHVGANFFEWHKHHS